jgi:hypothetical protein
MIKDVIMPQFGIEDRSSPADSIWAYFDDFSRMIENITRHRLDAAVTAGVLVVARAGVASPSSGGTAKRQ